MLRTDRCAKSKLIAFYKEDLQDVLKNFGYKSYSNIKRGKLWRIR